MDTSTDTELAASSNMPAHEPTATSYITHSGEFTHSPTIRMVFALYVYPPIVAAIFVWLPSNSGDMGTARVFIDNALVAELPLDTDCEYTAQSGDGINIVEVSKGRVHIKSANCADEYCVKQGYISHGGQTLICLPHRLVVELAVSDEGEENAFDAIAG